MDVSFAIKRVDNKGGSLLSETGTIGFIPDLEQLDNTGGTLNSAKDMSLVIRTPLNDKNGRIFSGGRLGLIVQRDMENDGTLGYSGLDMHAVSLTNEAGRRLYAYS